MGVEVSEYLARGCDGPPARVWHIDQRIPGSCISLRPKMTAPNTGKGAAQHLGPQVLYGHVSCEILRNRSAGFIELCQDETCDPSGCQRVGLMPEGQCGFSFRGFAASSWRCVP